MIGEHDRNWFEHRPLSAIARSHYSFIDSSTAARTIDVLRLLRSLEESGGEAPVRLDLRGVRLLPIEKEEKCAIYRVALNLFSGKRGSFPSINDDSCEALFFFLEEFTAPRTTPPFDARDRLSPSLLSLIEKIDRSWKGKEREQMLETLAILFSSVHGDKFLLLDEESLCRLLVESLKLSKKERVSLIERLMTKFDLFHLTTFKTILDFVIHLSDEERASCLEIIDLPSFPFFLTIEGKQAEMDSEEIVMIHAILKPFLCEKREEIINFAHLSSDFFSLSLKIDWLYFLSDDWEEKKRIVVLCCSALRGLSISSAINLVKRMRKLTPEKREKLFKSVLPLMEYVGVRERGSLVDLCRRLSTVRVRSLLEESKSLFNKIEQKEILSYKVSILSSLDRIKEDKREELIQLLEEGIGEKRVGSDLIAILLKMVQASPQEERLILVHTAMTLVPMTLFFSLEELQEILQLFQKILPKKRKEVAALLVRFSEVGISSWISFHKMDRLRFITILALLSPEEAAFIEEERSLFDGCEEPIAIFDLLRKFPPTKESKRVIDHLITILRGSTHRGMADRLLSHLLTIDSEKRDSFLSSIECIFHKLEEQESASSFIEILMTLLLLHREGEEKSFFDLAQHALDGSFDPLPSILVNRIASDESAHNLTSRSEKGYIPQETALKVAKIIMNYQELLPDDHPLFLWAFSTLSFCTPEAMRERKNPYRLHQELQWIVASENVVDLPKERVPTFDVEISATKERFFCRWNIQAMRYLSQGGGGPLECNASSIPEGITHTTLNELYESMRNRLQNIEELIYQKSGLTLDQLQAFFDDPFIKSRSYHLDPSLPAGRVLPRDVLQLSYILKRICHSSPLVPADGEIAPREELLLTLASSVQCCSTGKSNAINDYYNALEPKYRRLVEIKGPKEFLNDLFQRVLHHLFAKEELLQKLAGNIEGGQTTHISRFLKNRLKEQLGLQANIEFDPYTMGVPDTLIGLFERREGLEKALIAFLEQLSIEEFLHASGAKAAQKLIQAIASVDAKSAVAMELLEELKVLSEPIQKPLFGVKNFSVTSTIVARGLGHTAEDDYTLTQRESDRLFTVHEGMMEEGIIPLTEELIVRMLFATVLTATKIEG